MSLIFRCDKCGGPIRRPASIRQEIGFGYELTIRKVPGETEVDLCTDCAVMLAKSVLAPTPVMEPGE